MAERASPGVAVLKPPLLGPQGWKQPPSPLPQGWTVRASSIPERFSAAFSFIVQQQFIRIVLSAEEMLKKSKNN